MLLAGSSQAAGVARAVPLLYPAPRGDTVVCTDTLSPSSHIMYTPPPSSLTYPRTCIYEHMHIHLYAYRELEAAKAKAEAEEKVEENAGKARFESVARRRAV